MGPEKRLRRRAVAPALGIVLGLVAGIATVAWSTAAAGRADTAPGGVFDATHLPPLLRAPGEPVELAYDVHCALPDDESGEGGCDLRGTLFARPVGERAFTPLRLESRERDGVRRLVTAVPDALAADARGFEYYAVLEAADLGARFVVPAGAAQAPHVSRRLDGAVTVDLGHHSFGERRRQGVRVAAAAWGDGPADVGLEPGHNLAPIGASAFDVDSRGNVLLLDQAHRRVLRWTAAGEKRARVSVPVAGTVADLAVADDGSLYVLETVAAPGENPRVRRFDDLGRELEAVEIAERGASQIRMSPQGPVVLGAASHHWLPVFVDGTPASAAEQSKRGRAGRRFSHGVEVVVFWYDDEIRAALVAGSNVIRSWRLTSATPVAEVQLAEPQGQGLVLVVRLYDAKADEFAVLVLDRNGLADRFALDAADWAETAPLGRFRLRGTALYRLGSTPAGAFVDRFDLEVR